MVKIDENEDFDVCPHTGSSEHFLEIPFTQSRDLVPAQSIEIISYYIFMNLTYMFCSSHIFVFSILVFWSL